MKINYYYFGKQCPIIEDTLRQWKNDVKMNCFDISEDFALAKQKKMYFPFLIECNNKRYFAPFTQDTLTLIKEGKREEPYIVPLGKEVREGTITPLTQNNIRKVKGICTLNGCAEDCIRKAIFLQKHQDIYGFIHEYEGEVVAGVEYMPSTMIPYDIVRDKKTAFITCLYSPYNEFDYRSTVLKELEIYLKDKYDDVLIISDERSNFPNGTLPFFLKRGYIDQGVVDVEEGYCRLHLLRKRLK